MNLETTKLSLIKAIAEIQSASLIQQLWNIVSRFQSKSSTDSPNDLLEIGKQPTPASVSLEDLKREQGFSMEKLNQAYASLDRSIWEDEDIDELIKMI